ncbi:MAG: hypothetical protein PW843_22125 [Azospirillaceae bacterium]|nr:hypothetical protein [Azospirillaceae bacterium]
MATQSTTATGNEQANREHVAKLVRLLGSDYEGEAVTALAKLRRMLPKRGLGFNDVGQWIATPGRTTYKAAPASPPPDLSPYKHRIATLERQKDEALRALRQAQARADEAEDQAGQLVSELVATRMETRQADTPAPAEAPSRRARRWRRYVKTYALAVVAGVALAIVVHAYVPSAGAANVRDGLLSRAAMMFSPPANTQAHHPRG